MDFNLRPHLWNRALEDLAPTFETYRFDDESPHEDVLGAEVDEQLEAQVLRPPPLRVHAAGLGGLSRNEDGEQRGQEVELLHQGPDPARVVERSRS